MVENIIPNKEIFPKSENSNAYVDGKKCKVLLDMGGQVTSISENVTGNISAVVPINLLTNS